jgi:hypothetical protein
VINIAFFQMGEHGFVNKSGGADHFMDRRQEWLAANRLLSEAEAEPMGLRNRGPPSVPQERHSNCLH